MVGQRLNELKKRIRYCSETGNFYHINPRIGIKKGSIAGYQRPNDSYIQIRMEGKSYLAHRLAWLFHYGKYPKGEIDHINRVRNDNRILNLRDVSHFDNMQNGSEPYWNGRYFIKIINYKKHYFKTIKQYELLHISINNE